MFAKFYHNELNEIKTLQQKLIAVYQLYIDKSFSLDLQIYALLNEIIKYYKSKNEEQQITWAQSLLSELKTAKRGIHPFTLERVTIRRNELCMTTCYKIIQNVNDKFSAENTKLTNKIEEAETLLKQIVLSAIQLNEITTNEIKLADTQELKASLWNKILIIDGMQQHTRNLALMVSNFDIFIMLDEIRSAFI
jgi:hypothetical protein